MNLSSDTFKNYLYWLKIRGFRSISVVRAPPSKPVPQLLFLVFQPLENNSDEATQLLARMIAAMGVSTEKAKICFFSGEKDLFLQEIKNYIGLNNEKQCLVAFGKELITYIEPLVADKKIKSIATVELAAMLKDASLKKQVWKDLQEGMEFLKEGL
jgi:hypothetical protein